MPPVQAEAAHMTTSMQRQRLINAKANDEALKKERKATDLRVERVPDVGE